jgi:hypothetical protein
MSLSNVHLDVPSVWFSLAALPSPSLRVVMAIEFRVRLFQVSVQLWPVRGDAFKHCCSLLLLLLCVCSPCRHALRSRAGLHWSRLQQASGQRWKAE